MIALVIPCQPGVCSRHRHRVGPPSAFSICLHHLQTQKGEENIPQQAQTEGGRPPASRWPSTFWAALLSKTTDDFTITRPTLQMIYFSLTINLQTKATGPQNTVWE